MQEDAKFRARETRNKLKRRSASRKSKLILMLKKTNSKERDSHGDDDGATGDTNYRWRDRGSRTKETEATKIKQGETKHRNRNADFTQRQKVEQTWRQDLRHDDRNEKQNTNKLKLRPKNTNTEQRKWNRYPKSRTKHKGRKTIIRTKA